MDVNGDYDQLLHMTKVVKDRVRGVVHGTSNGMYLFGRPGTAKTYMVCTTLDSLGAKYTYNNGHLTPVGLFNLIDQNRDRVIVLDDVSAIFGQPTALQILLAALGNRHDKSKDRLVRYTSVKGDLSVPFSGGIICISNLPLNGHKDKVVAALTDRVYVIEYNPSDEQISATIYKICENGVPGISPGKCRAVADFLLQECKSRKVRPSVRLFVDKAIKDFELFTSGNTETHWKDLIVSNLKQGLVQLEHPTKDLSRAEQTECERRVALEICQNYGTKAERIEEWGARTGRSQSAFYRRCGELKRDGRLTEAKLLT